jgi:hypothetical protein
VILPVDVGRLYGHRHLKGRRGFVHATL